MGLRGVATFVYLVAFGRGVNDVFGSCSSKDIVKPTFMAEVLNVK